MRNHSLTRLSTLLAVCAAPWAFAADTPLDETKTRIALPMDVAPIIDGVINDEEWAQSGNAGWAFAIVEGDLEPDDDGITGADLRNGEKPSDNADLSANLFAGVVGENLYIGVRVTDDDISTDTAEAGSENGMTWLDDSVEVFIDGDNSNFGERDTTGENPEVVDSGGQFVITANNAYRHAEAGNPRFDASSGWFAETKVVDGEGYHAEFRIPLSLIGNPQPGEHIGFTVAINDDDGGGGSDSVLIWTGLDHVEETFGNLVVGHRRYEGLKAAPPTIDGKIEDGEYPGADIVSINPFTGVFRVGDDQPVADDISFDWRVTHNEDAIYIALRVTDDVIFTDTADAGSEDAQTWNDDSVEIFFDSNESNLSGRDDTEMFDGQFVFTPNGAWRDNEANNPTYGPDGDWWAQATEADDGKSWDVEFLIKKSALVGGDREDVPMGFNVNINDDDDGGNRETQLNWDGDPHTESSYGELILLSAIPSDPNAVADRSVRFGRLDQSAVARTETLRIRNAGDTQTLTLSDAVITGPNQDVFTLGDFPTSLAPGEEGLATITFDAGGAKGNYEATLSYTTNDPNDSEANLTASLSASVANLAGPVARYSLDESADAAEMLDVSTFDRHGTFEGGPTLGQEALIPSGTSALFSGGSYGQVPGDVFDSFIRFTVAAWVNLNDLTDQQTVFAKGSTDGAPTFALLSSGGNLEWFSNGEPEFASDAGVLTAGTTHHVAVTWSTNKAVIYVDGVAVAEQEVPNEIEIVQENPFLVGAFHGGLKMEGRMDDVQFYDRAVSADDVNSLFATPGSELANVEAPGPGPGGGGGDGQELLVNGSFEDPAVDNINMNNLGVVPTGWSQTGDDTTWNVIRNDGTAYDNGVDNAAEGSQVLDLNGLFVIFQNFTVAEDTAVQFGASFANRAGHEGDPSTVGIYDAAGTTLVSSEVSVDTSGDAQPSEVWATGEGTAMLTAGDYQIRVALNNWNNVDAVFVTTGSGGGGGSVVSQWSFEDNLDDTGALGGTADALIATGVAEYVPGVVGNAVNITADGLQRLRAEDSDDLDLGADWTLEAFVWPDANNIGEWDRFWTKWGDGGEQWHTSFRSTGAVDVDNGLDLFINGGNNIINSNTTAEVPLETWSHVAFVGDSVAGTITTWLNGVQVGSAAYEAVEPGDGAMNFGNFESPANELQYSGLIDEAAIHNVAVTSEYLVSRADLRPSGGDTGRPISPMDVGFGADGASAFGITLPDGQTGDIEYSIDLIDWETIATGVNGRVDETDAVRAAAPSGYYRVRQ